MSGLGFLRSLSITRKLILLLLIVFLPVSGIIITSSLSRRADAILEAENTAMRFVKSLAAQQERMAFGVRQMLGTLARLPEVKNLDAAFCNELFREIIEKHQFYSVISIATPDGALFASSRPLEPGRFSAADRKLHQDAVRTLDFSVSQFNGERSEEPSISFAYPVLDSDNNLVAVLSAGFKLAEYAQFLTKLNLPQASTCSIADHKGICLFCFPETDVAAPGIPLAEESFRIMSGNREEAIYEKTAQDGIYRIYAFKRLRLGEDSPPYLYISVGISKSQITAKADLNMLRDLSDLGFLGLLVMLLAWMSANHLLIRPINQLVETTRLFGKGRMGTRTCLPHTSDELGRLAESFDEMGALLETRNIERMLAEEGLKSSEGRLKILFECAPDPYYITDIDGRIVNGNKAAVQITGYSREELTGKNLFELDLLLPEDAPRAAGLLAQNALGHPTGPEEFILKRKDGTQVFLEARAFPTVIAGQTVVLGIARDITKRKQALEALQKSRQQLANVINFLPDATFAIDKKGRVIAWNRAMEEMSGVSAADMLGKGDYEYAMCFYGERRPTLIDLVLDPGGEVEANYLSLTRKGDVLCGEAYHQGYKRYFYGKASVLFDSKGNVAGAIESIQDITERRLMMEGPEGHLHRLQVKSGLSGFHESEVLEFLLTYAIPGKDVRRIAKDLLNEFGNNLASVFDAPVEALQRVEGIQERAAVLIGLMPHLFDCYQSCRWVRPKTFASTDAVVSYLRALLGTRRNETFCVLALDSQNQLIAVEQLQRGSINRTAVFPRQVAETCLKHRATAVILAHNHPGGSPLPSVADRQLTQRLKNILGDLDIAVHDHIIIAGLDQYFSFAEIGGLNECSIGCGVIVGDDKKRF